MEDTDTQILKNRAGRVEILGIAIDAMTMQQVLDIADECIAARRQLLLGVVNVAKLVNARRDHRLRQSIEQADIVLADGAPLVWLSRALGTPLPSRVPGIDIMVELLKRADKKHWRVYFLGARPEVLSRLMENVQSGYAGVQVAGCRDGYFSQPQEEDVAAAIRNSNADILFVGISSPKKENFLSRWRGFMNVPVCHGVGGSFDVLAGVIKRAPVWMQRRGLEWLYRLVQEPRRMWKRYLTTNVVFIVLGVKAILKSWVLRLRRRLCGVFSSQSGRENG